MYAAQMDMSYEDAIWWNGLAKTMNGKNANHPDWGNPSDWYNPVSWWTKERLTNGQNPADADLIKAGYAQFSEYKEPTSNSKMAVRALPWNLPVPVLDPINNPFVIF